MRAVWFFWKIIWSRKRIYWQGVNLITHCGLVICVMIITMREPKSIIMSTIFQNYFSSEIYKRMYRKINKKFRCRDNWGEWNRRKDNIGRSIAYKWRVQYWKDIYQEHCKISKRLTRIIWCIYFDVLRRKWIWAL